MMLRLASLVFLAASVAGLANAQPVNRFDDLHGLSAAQEAALNVLTVPSDAVKVGEARGVPLYALPEAGDVTERAAVVRKILADLPPLFDAFPPKGIFLSGAGLPLPEVDRRNAAASGPYIVLYEGFYDAATRRVQGPDPQARILAHEFAHVLQYYYADPEREGRFRLATHSTLMDGWAEATGWTQDDEGSWLLPRAVRSGTTRYGATSPVEDQADALAFLVLGQEGYVSPDRVKFLEQAIDKEGHIFAQGVLPLPPEFVPMRRLTLRLSEIFDGLEPRGDGAARAFFLKDVADAEAQMAAFEAEMAARGFDLKSKAWRGSGGARTYEAVWQYKAQKVTLGAYAYGAGQARALLIKLGQEVVP